MMKSERNNTKKIISLKKVNEQVLKLNAMKLIITV